MGRTPRPRYRADRDLWYVTIKGARYTLGKGEHNREAAEREFHRIMSGPQASKPAPKVEGETVASICNRYLDHARTELAPLTYEFYKRHLVPFGAAHPDLAASDLRPHHVLDWAGSKPWNPTTRAGAITTIKRAFSWAARHRHIPEDPIKATEKPRARRREAIPTQAELERFLAAIDNPNFRDLVVALRESGCRPNEVFAMEAKHFDPGEGTWTVVNKTRNHGDQTRVVYLSDAMVELSNRLAGARPKGRLFVNSRGGPWKRHAVIHRFIRLREKLGMGPEVTAYALRHLFVTDGLERGVPIATMAELVGHRNTTMISKVYSKLSERTKHLRDAVRRARGEKTGHDDKP
jgi:integrase